MADTRGPLRSADTMLAPLVASSLAEIELEECDAAAVRLAVQYAQAIDASEYPETTLEKLGPKLLTCLESLGATPGGRVRGRAGGAPAGGALAQFRQRNAG